MRGLLSAAVACAAAFSVAEARAEIWAFSYSGAYQGVVYSASGAFTTGNVGSPYTITGVSGTADGYPITGLSPWAAANQLLYYDGSGVYADYNGITFAANGADYNLSNYPSGNSLLVSTLDPNITICCQIGLSMTVTDVGSREKFWNFSYSGTYQGVVYSASGVFITGDLGSPYTVIGVSGTADGQAIIGLSSWAAADQLLYYDASGVYTDYYGITFATDDADYNLSNYPSGNSLLISTLDPNITICCQISLDMTVSAPELSTWAMMGVGFGALAYAGYRARCAAAAAA